MALLIAALWGGGSASARETGEENDRLFREAGNPESIERPRVEDFRTGLGYGFNSPQPWFKTFYRIGTYHIGRHVFAAARRAQRQFISERLSHYVYYAMEVTTWYGLAILHRNHFLIEARLAELRGVPSVPLDPVEHGAYKQARIDAGRIARSLEGGVDQGRLDVRSFFTSSQNRWRR